MAAAVAGPASNGYAAAMPSDLAGVERMCEQLYTAEDTAIRKRAESTLFTLTSSTVHLPKCLTILDNSSVPYAQKFAAWVLTRILVQHGPQVTKAERIQLRNYVLNYLAKKGPQLQPHVVMELSLVLVKVTRLGWNDDDVHRTIVDDLNSFLSASRDHCVIGLEVLALLVSEMNNPAGGSRRRSISHSHARRIAISFRELLLQKVFKIALTAMGQAPVPPEPPRVLKRGIVLALACLSYDFVGGSLDESNEDVGTIHIPVGWAGVVEDPNTFKLFFDCYKALCASDPNHSSKCIECLVHLASMRRTLFSTDALRIAHIRRHVEGTLEVLRSRQGLDDHLNYHHFCRWLSRLKTNYQLDELVGLNSYQEWLSSTAQFTMHSLASDWGWVGGSLHYLLNLWTRLIAAKPYLKGGKDANMDGYITKIVEQYISTRLHAVSSGSDDDEDDDFSEQLGVIPMLFRLQYEKSAVFVNSLMDPRIGDYKRLAAKRFQGENPVNVSRLERELAWLTRVAGAVVSGRLSSSGTESSEMLDGDMSARVFQLMIYTSEADAASNQRPGVSPVSMATPQGRARNTKGGLILDDAIIDFAQAFRRAYIGEEAVATSKVYVRLVEKLGMTNNMVVLNVVATKIASNLRSYGVVDGLDIIAKSLTLLADLAGGYSSSRLLCKLPTICEMIAHHDEEHFPFMSGPDEKMGRHRTTFYHTLLRILFASGGPDFDLELEFTRFMEPLRIKLEALGAIQSKETFLKDPSVKNAVVGVLRDLRGVISTMTTRKAYSVLFDWMYPHRTPIILKLCEVFSEGGVPQVTTPLLKLFSEFIFNKAQRIAFESSSPNGILMFRETSKILVTYGNYTLANWDRLGGVEAAVKNGVDIYRALYKGLWVCFLIFMRTIAGGYVNFGVFALYGDPALVDAVNVIFRMVMAISVEHVLAFPKVSRAYFGLMEVLFASHPKEVVRADHPVFVRILQTLQEGLQSHEVWMSTQSATAIDQIAAFRFTHCMKNTDWGRMMQAHVEQSPDLFPSCLEVVFKTIIHVDCTNQWSLSRPLLALILTNEETFMRIKASLIHSQVTSEGQAAVEAAFNDLMKDIVPSVESKNRDKFTHRVTGFRIALRSAGAARQ